MPELAARQRVSALMAEYRTQQKELGDVESQLLEAADEAAHDILMATRRDIRAALVRARRELLELTADVASVTNAAFDPAQETFLATRQYMHTVLAETRTDLHSVDKEATARGFDIELDPATMHITLPAREPGRRTTAASAAAPPLMGSGRLLVTGVAVGALAIGFSSGRWPWRAMPTVPTVSSEPAAAAPVPMVAVANAAPAPAREAPFVLAAAAAPLPVTVKRVAPAVAPPVAKAPPAPASPSAPTPLIPAPARTLPLREELLNASQRWLDAYYRQDKSAMAQMAIPDVSVEDERKDAERIPRGLPDVQRTLTGVNFHQTSTVAMITANMSEQSGDSHAPASYISHLWVRQDGTWQLQTVRLTTAAPSQTP